MKINRNFIALGAALLVLVASGCTDAERSSLMAYGSPASVTCYSGGQIIFEDESTGKVLPLDGDGLSFRSKSTNKLVRAYADCILIDK